MLKNFFNIAIRNLVSQKYYAAINMLGLAVSLAAVLLIGLYVISEFSYDRHHQDSERIYRIERDFIFRDEDMLLPGNASATGALLAQTFAEVEAYTRIFPRNFRLARGEQLFYEDAVRAVDANHFAFFAYEWRRGEPEAALAEPFTIVLTESLAQKYFGDANPMGETLVLEEQVPLTVTGVIADLSANTHITASAFVSISSMPAIEGDDFFNSWDMNNFHTYVRLAPGVAYDEVGAAFKQYLFDAMPERQSGLWDFNGINVRDIHLYSRNRREELSPPGSIANLRALMLIAVGLLCIGCINFINITTAKAMRRGKEIALKKTLGSGSFRLMLQFWGESGLQIFLASCLGITLVELLLPRLSVFLDIDMPATPLQAPQGILLLSGSLVFLTLVAGAYPAFYLSRLSPTRIFRGQTAQAGKSVPLRSLLVIFQFTVSIVLLISTLVVGMQLKLGREIELGFSKERVLLLETTKQTGYTGMAQKDFGPQWFAFKNELLSHPGIGNVTRSNLVPFNFTDRAFMLPVFYEGGGEQSLDMTVMYVDFDFFETYDVGVLAGRTFSEEFANDRHPPPTPARPVTPGTYIINEAAAARFGWAPVDALGKWLNTPENNIVGVVENMKMESLRQEVKPVYYYVRPDVSMPLASLRLTGQDLTETLAYIDTTWQKFFPEQPISRTFLDSDFNALYLSDTQFAKFTGFFSLLTVFVACLGLHGLAAFSAEQRIKEIGIRKVVGSSVFNIIALFTRDFSRLILLANLIAWPVAYLAMESWLENFAYRIDLTPLIFIGAGLIALCIAWVTVGGTAAKAASQRPVLALRYE